MFLIHFVCFVLFQPQGNPAYLSHTQIDDSALDSVSPLDLILLWETKLDSNSNIDNNNTTTTDSAVVVQGQQNLCDVSFLTPTTVDKAVSEDHSTLRFTIESPRKVIHDFTQQRYTQNTCV